MSQIARTWTHLQCVYVEYVRSFWLYLRLRQERDPSLGASAGPESGRRLLRAQRAGL